MSHEPSSTDFEDSNVETLVRRSRRREQGSSISSDPSKGSKGFEKEIQSDTEARYPLGNSGDDANEDEEYTSGKDDDASDDDDNGGNIIGREIAPSTRGQNMYANLIQRLYNMSLYKYPSHGEENDLITPLLEDIVVNNNPNGVMSTVFEVETKNFITKYMCKCP